MVLQSGGPIYVAGIQESEVIRMAAMATKFDKDTNRPDNVRKLDALDTLVLNALDVEKQFDRGEVQTEFMPFDAEVKRTEGTIKEANGRVIKYTKGASAVILKLIGDDQPTA